MCIRDRCHLCGFHGNNSTIADDSCLKLRTACRPTALVQQLSSCVKRARFHSVEVMAAVQSRPKSRWFTESRDAWRSTYTRSQYATWLNWSSNRLRCGLTPNWPSLTGPLSSGENDSRPGPLSRLRDNILNSCCNLYFHLSCTVCIDSKFSMIEKLLKKAFHKM